MFEREAGTDMLERVQEYRDFHWLMESLADRTSWPDGRRKKRWGPRTIYKTASELVVFFEWAHKFGFTKRRPLKDGHVFDKSPGKQPEFFDWDDEDFKKILCDPNNTLRMTAILHVLRSSGIRASECCNLKISDAEDHCLKIRQGKGGEPRYAPVDEECAKWLGLYLGHLKVHYAGEWLFPKEDFSGPINAHGLWKMLYLKGRKIGVRLYPHKLRHSLGGALAERGVDALTISEVLGHKDISTSRGYFHLKKQKVIQAYRVAFSKPA